MVDSVSTYVDSVRLTLSTISGPWHSNDPRPSPDFYPRVQGKTWEWAGDKAKVCGWYLLSIITTCVKDKLDLSSKRVEISSNFKCKNTSLWAVGSKFQIIHKHSSLLPLNDFIGCSKFLIIHKASVTIPFLCELGMDMKLVGHWQKFWFVYQFCCYVNNHVTMWPHPLNVRWSMMKGWSTMT